MELLMGFNPVEAALESPRRTVDRIWLLEGRGDPRAGRILSLARDRGIPVQRVDRQSLERLCRGAPRSAHQGILASVSAIAYEDPVRILETRGPVSRLLVVDGVEDPRNLGALIRTAAGAGAEAVFFPERRSAGLTATVSRAAAGAGEKVPLARVGNVAAFIKILKEKEFWVIGLDAASEISWDALRYPERMALVVGGESRGLRPLVRRRCDQVVSIPLAAGVESLNVSVAAGICLYEALRQVRAGKSSIPPFT